MSNSQIEAYERVQVVAGDAPEDMQKEIINILIRVKKLYGSHSQVSSHDYATFKRDRVSTFNLDLSCISNIIFIS